MLFLWIIFCADRNLLFCSQTKLRFLDKEFLGGWGEGSIDNVLARQASGPEFGSPTSSEKAKHCSTRLQYPCWGGRRRQISEAHWLAKWPAELVNSGFIGMKIPDNLWPPFAHVKTHKNVYKHRAPEPHTYIFKPQKHENYRTGATYDKSFFFLKKKSLLTKVSQNFSALSVFSFKIAHYVGCPSMHM